MMTYGLLIPGLFGCLYWKIHKNKENEKKAVLEKLRSYRVKGGGYSNLRDREVATTNATVAALAIIGQLEGYKPIDDLLFTGYAG